MVSLADNKYRAELVETARKIASPGKGILAADESTGTIGKRLAAINVENTEDNRRAYRELLFSAPDEWAQYISGVIMYEETLFQKAADGTPFVDMLAKVGVVPGIKLDLGLREIPGSGGEMLAQGLDNLDERCARYYAQGARFAKWRNVLTIGEGRPSETVLDMNAEVLARYAAVSQAHGLVPIVEPEVLMDGAHGIEVCARVTQRIVARCYHFLDKYGVVLEGTLLKPNMVLPGSESGAKATPAEVAAFTVTALRRSVPAAVPGIMFLSGGQSEEEATVNLNAINNAPGPRPWSLSFSYGRALQHSVLRKWLGKKENVAAAQAVLIERARANSQAQQGKYEGGGADAAASERLFQKNYVY